MQFVECDTRRALPGTPPLCSGCLANRETISKLTQGRMVIFTEERTAHLKALLERIHTSNVILVRHGEPHPLSQEEIRAIYELLSALSIPHSTISVLR